jgi:hypothetical protein
VEKWVVVGEPMNFFMVVAWPSDVKHWVDIRVDEPWEVLSEDSTRQWIDLT